MIQLEKVNDHNETIFRYGFPHLQGAPWNEIWLSQWSKERPEPAPDVPIDTQQYRSYKAPCHSNANFMGRWNPAIIHVLIPRISYWFTRRSDQKPRPWSKNGKNVIRTRTDKVFSCNTHRFFPAGAGASHWPSHSPDSHPTVWGGLWEICNCGIGNGDFFPKFGGWTSTNHP